MRALSPRVCVCVCVCVSDSVCVCVCVCVSACVHGLSSFTELVCTIYGGGVNWGSSESVNARWGASGGTRRAADLIWFKPLRQLSVLWPASRHTKRFHQHQKGEEHQQHLLLVIDMPAAPGGPYQLRTCAAVAGAPLTGPAAQQLVMGVGVLLLTAVVAVHSGVFSSAAPPAAGAPPLAGTREEIEGTEVVWQLPQGAAKAVLLAFHGCSHGAIDWWPRGTACPSCIGAVPLGPDATQHPLPPQQRLRPKPVPPV
jgi:hypothetical protein